MSENKQHSDAASGKAPDTSRDGTPLTDKARAFAHEAVESASTKAEDVERKLRSEARRAADSVDRGEARARHQLDETLTSMEAFIRERPMAGAGMAFVAGMLAAMILRR
jgi:ElaB/YqjD/DUF883 family membrane-anchored ribosome-binding protein